MMMIVTLSLVTSLLAERTALETDASFGPRGQWSVLGPTPDAAVISLTVVLALTDAQHQELEANFWAVSDPDSERYGQHFSQAEVTSVVANSNAVTDVTAWLMAGGARHARATVHKDAVEALIGAREAEQLLGAKFFEYRHEATGVVVSRIWGGYSVPSALDHVALVEGIGRLPSLEVHGNVLQASTPPYAVEGARSGSEWPTDCAGPSKLQCYHKVTPAVLARRYSLGPPPTAANGSSLAVAEFQGQLWDQKDLDKFASVCSGSVVGNVTVSHEAGRVEPGKRCRIPVLGTEFCGEALLDIEYAKAIGGAIPLTDVYASGYSLVKWAKTVEAMPDGHLPLVHSISYGNDEAQSPNSVAYMAAANADFQKIGLRGVSILIASGDQGVCGREGCILSKGRFHPNFPCSSPYVTAVGGTDFAEKTVIGEEKAWSDSGGGFSDAFAAPAYQTAAIAAYKARANASLPAAEYYNQTGRGYPDVSALAGEQNAYCIAAAGSMLGIAGTSAACPVTAAIFARLNALRLGSGGKPLGFLNPWIYKHAAAFNDVTKGVNNAGSQKYGGFAAVQGWDPATGVGTPNFAAMAKLL